MNREVQKLWTVALRSGEFKQGRGIMHDAKTDTYCCLGVLSELAARRGICVRGEYGDEQPRVTQYDGWTSYLPVSVIQWAELSNQDPFVYDIENKKAVPATLSSLNDSGRTFEKIADAIESSL